MSRTSLYRPILCLALEVVPQDYYRKVHIGPTDHEETQDETLRQYTQDDYERAHEEYAVQLAEYEIAVAAYEQAQLAQQPQGCAELDSHHDPHEPSSSCCNIL